MSNNIKELEELVEKLGTQLANNIYDTIIWTKRSTSNSMDLSFVINNAVILEQDTTYLVRVIDIDQCDTLSREIVFDPISSSRIQFARPRLYSHYCRPAHA